MYLISTGHDFLPIASERTIFTQHNNSNSIISWYP